MTAALLLGGPRHLERWPVPIGPDGLPVRHLLAAPRMHELERMAPTDHVEAIRYERRDHDELDDPEVWRYVHPDYRPPRLARARGPAPAGVTLETVIEVVDGTELVFFGQSLGVIQTAKPVLELHATAGGDVVLGLEYEAIVDPHLVDRVRARHPEVDHFLTYETEEV